MQWPWGQGRAKEEKKGTRTQDFNHRTLWAAPALKKNADKGLVLALVFFINVKYGCLAGIRIH